ncbi:hypothetical protein [Kitasatospora sp. NPDC057500]|uniref:hypothetical protein n=1 Tax=Kitasatospora sp. NPDC057500 TaxID=3346151 RepID=UPI0036790C01
MSGTQPSCDPRRTRRRRVIGILVIGPLVLLAAGVALLYWAYEQDLHPKPDSGRPGAWMTVSSDEVSRFARVPVPTAAVDVRWAYQNGFQDDLAFLAFRLPQTGLNEFRDSLPVTEWREGKYIDSGDLGGFLHIGAPDPSTVSPLACGSFYSPGGAKQVGTTVCFAEQADGASQVWVSAVQTA